METKIRVGVSRGADVEGVDVGWGGRRPAVVDLRNVSPIGCIIR